MRKQNNTPRLKKRFLIAALATSMMFCLAAGVVGCKDKKGENSSSSTSSNVAEEKSFELNVFNHTMLVNETYQLQIESQDLVDCSACHWETSNSDVVTVDAQGCVLAIGAGTAVVTATIGEDSSACAFVITENNVKPYLKVNADNNRICLQKDSKFALDAMVEYNEQSYTDFTCTYDSANKEIATVSDTGEITAVALGKATITVSATWRNGITFTETIVVEVISGAYIIVDKTDIELFSVNPNGYDFATAMDAAATLIDKGEEKEIAFAVQEVVADGETANTVAVYENGQFTAVGCGSTKFVFTCNYEGEELISDEITITVSMPRISLKQDFYKVKADNITVDLTETGVDITSVNKVLVNDTETVIDGTTISLAAAETGRYEISFYINNEEAEYTTDLIVADKLIANIEDLIATRNNLTGYYVLTQDIDAQGANVGHLFEASWYGGSGGAIGVHTMKDKGFKGTIDGNGHTISNIAVDGYGLFGTVSPEGVIKNLGIRNVMSTTTDGLNFPLATEFYGTMDNVSFHMTNYTEYAPIGILQLGSVLKNVVFYTPDVTYGAICLMGDCVHGSITFENVYIFSNKNIGGIQGNAPTATIFSASDYLSDERFISTDFAAIFDMSNGGEWFVEEDTKLPLINWTPTEYLPVIIGESKPFKNNEDIVLNHAEFDTVRGIYIGETELSSEYYSWENGRVTIRASYLSTMQKSTKITVKTSKYKVECVLQIAKEISTVKDFKNIVNDLYGYYELSNNIDFAGEFVQLKSWGDGNAWFNESVSATSTGFYGTFEGNGHVLKNFTTTWGIFGGIGDTGIVRNVGFENAENINHATTVSAVIATYSYGTIENISVKTADTSSFYSILARMRGSAKLHNAIVYAKKTVVGIMESNFGGEGSLDEVYFIGNTTNPTYTCFNVANYLEDDAFLAIDFTTIFDCSEDGIWKMDDALRLPFIYSDSEMPEPTVTRETKTFTVTSLDQVTCSNENVTLSMTDNQLIMGGAFDGTPFTLTITLPETYVTLTGISVENVWTNDGGGGTTAWVGEAYKTAAIFIHGTSGWGGSWVGASFQATADMIAAAGYDSNKNQVSITVQPSAGSQFILLNTTFTYEVYKEIAD